MSFRNNDDRTIASRDSSQIEIGGDKPCYQHLSGNERVSDYGVNQDLTRKLTVFVDLHLTTP
jgi:hypothetical protein